MPATVQKSLYRPLSRAQKWALTKHWLSLAAPCAATYALAIAPGTVSLAWVGRIGTTELAAVSLAETWMFSLLELVWMALATTQQTLIGQAHGASNRESTVGWALIGGTATLSVAGMIAILMAFGDPILRAFGLDTYDGLTRMYLLTAIPFAIFTAVVTSFSAYLTATHQTLIGMLAECTSTATEVTASYLLVNGAGKLHRFGMQGAALALDAAGGVGVLAYIVATTLGKPRRHTDAEEDAPPELMALLEEGITHDEQSSRDGAGLLPAASKSVNAGEPTDAAKPEEPLDWRRVRNFFCSRAKWAEFWKQGAPNCLSTIVEQGQLVIISLLAAGLGPADIAAHNAMLNLFQVISAVVYGMGEATTVAVGYHLGRRDPAAARFVAIASTSIATAWSLLIAVVLVLCRNVVGRIFSDDPDVIQLCSQIVLLCSPAYVVLTVCILFLCILDAQARASIIAAIFVLGCWCIAIPLAFVSAKKTQLGLEGLWGSLVIGYTCTMILATFACWRSDWELLSDEAVARSASVVDEPNAPFVSTNKSGGSSPGNAASPLLPLPPSAPTSLSSPPSPVGGVVGRGVGDWHHDGDDAAAMPVAASV